MNQQEAKSHLRVAKKHLKRASEAVAEGDSEEFIVWAFYAYESAVAAGAKAAEIPFDEKKHWDKARVARKLCDQGIVSQDIADELADLNALRKGVQYDEPDFADPEFDEFDEPGDLEGKLALLEGYIGEIEEYVKTHREENDKGHKGGQSNSGNNKKTR